MLPSPPRPSPWRRDLHESSAHRPRIHHSIESTWVTECDAVLAQHASAARPGASNTRQGAQQAFRWQQRLVEGLQRATTPRAICRMQGTLYLGIALWSSEPLRPLRHWMGVPAMPSSMHALSAMLGGVGAVLLAGAWRHAPQRAVAILGGGVATGLAMLDLTYLATGQAAAVCWLDVVFEVGLATGWLSACVQPPGGLERPMAPRPGRRLTP
jgi:hypothetical protein